MKKNKNIKELISEISVTDLFIKRVAEKADLDIRKFPIDKLIKGFGEEMELHLRMGLSPVDTLNIVYDNLSKDINYYDNIINLNFSKKKELTKESEGVYNYKRLSHILVIKNGVDNFDDKKRDLVKKFIIFVSQNLSLTKDCKIYLSATRNKHLETTASYNPNNDDIWIYVKNRNMLGDVLRSLAHEMMHFKQKLRGELHKDSGKDGSPHENEANTFSGIMIRKFGRMFPEIYH
jgi:hypothetical protein